MYGHLQKCTTGVPTVRSPLSEYIELTIWRRYFGILTQPSIMKRTVPYGAVRCRTVAVRASHVLRHPTGILPELRRSVQLLLVAENGRFWCHRGGLATFHSVGCSTSKSWIFHEILFAFHQFYAAAANRMIFLIAAIARARCVDINFVSVHHQAASSRWDTMYWRSAIFMKNQWKSMIP